MRDIRQKMIEAVLAKKNWPELYHDELFSEENLLASDVMMNILNICASVKCLDTTEPEEDSGRVDIPFHPSYITMLDSKNNPLSTEVGYYWHYRETRELSRAFRFSVDTALLRKFGIDPMLVKGVDLPLLDYASSAIAMMTIHYHTGDKAKQILEWTPKGSITALTSR